MRCFAPAVCELGNVEMVGTEFGERSHKDVKAAVAFTNGHREDILRQVWIALACAAALASDRRVPADGVEPHMSFLREHDLLRDAACQVDLGGWQERAVLVWSPAHSKITTDSGTNMSCT